MLCEKCGQEYEGTQCPHCDGPVIRINNDYIARRKAYESRQEKLKETKQKEEKLKESKLKESKRKKTSQKKREDDNPESDERANNHSVGRGRRKGHRKAVFLGVFLIAAAAVILVCIYQYRLSAGKSVRLYISKDSDIYQVDHPECSLVCSGKDVVYAADGAAFFTPKWPDAVDRSKLRDSAVADSAGKYFVAQTYDENSAMTTMYMWSDGWTAEISHNTSCHHEILCVTNEGSIIYTETEIINDQEYMGATLLKLAQIQTDPSKGDEKPTVKTTVISDNLKSVFVYKAGQDIIYLDNSGSLNVYNYGTGANTHISSDADGIFSMDSSQPYLYGQPDSFLNDSKKADSFIYHADGEIILYDIKKSAGEKVCSVDGVNMQFAYDKKNACIYLLYDRELFYTHKEDGIFVQPEQIGTVGNRNDIVFLSAAGQFLFVNEQGQLVSATRGKCKNIDSGVASGTFSRVKNTDKGITYISDNIQYYRQKPSADPIRMGEIHGITDTSDTCCHHGRLYYFSPAGTIQSCSVRGGSGSVVGEADKIWLVEELE